MTTAPVGKHRYWCFTWNNYPEDLSAFISWCEERTFIFGYEVAPETGTPHLQGWVDVGGGVTYQQLRAKWLIYWEPAVASAQSNWDYCSKGGNFVTSHPDGFVKKQGARNDIAKARNIITNGGKMQDVIMQATSMQSIRFAEIALKYLEPVRNWPCEVYWLHGPSGSGKSSKALELAPNAWWAGANHRWFDGYDAHADVVIDELREANWPFDLLLRLLDSKPMRVECKGGSRQWLAKRVIITTLRPPTETYRSTKEPMAQLLRRISSILEFPAREVGVIRASASAAADPDIVTELLELW